MKQISLSKTPLDKIISDIDNYRHLFNYDFSLHESLIGSRFKSADSVVRKVEKIKAKGGGFKQCFNDVLGFRLHVDTYPEVFPDYFRVVDLRNGKKEDDGYRAIHLYYQRDSHSYPIEIQIWDHHDFLFNTLTHQFLYKSKHAHSGRMLRNKYDKGNISDMISFMRELSSFIKNEGCDKNE